MPRHPPIALKTLDRSHCQCSPRKPAGFVAPQRNLEEIVATTRPRMGCLMPSAQKDQLLEIGPGAAVRQAHHMREIERLTATNHLHHRMGSFNKAWQPHLPSSHSEDGVRTNLLFTMSNRTSGSSRERTTNLGFE